MLRPDILWKNPVMFTVEVGTTLSVVYTVYKAVDPGSTLASLGYLIALDVWLFLTVLFANFAEALAEARGKAQADALRKTRQETPARRMRNPEFGMRNQDGAGSLLHSALRTPHSALERVSSTQLKVGDLVIVEAGEFVPGDGEIVEGIA